jgi:hypothetical protein
MRKIILALIMTMLLVPVVLADPKPKEPVDKITFIHYKDGEVKIVGGGPKADTCYKLMGIKWGTLPINYVINPGSYEQSFVTGAISASTATWDAATSRNLFNSYSIDPNAVWDSSSADGVNEYVFGPYSNSNVIAVTNVWYTRNTKQIVDYDVLFNTYYNWFDCTKIACSSSNNGMDLQNIATHETGHGLGLSDIYQSSCSAVTMYGYSSYGDTQKRDLAPADITGLRMIYGN